MLKRSLTLLALIGLAAPLSAQEEHEFSYDRPDASTFGAVLGDRLIPENTLWVGYVFEQADYDGIRFGTDELDAFTVFGTYATAPFDRTDRSHRLQFAYGVTDYLTVRASGVFVDYERDVIAEGEGPGELLLATTSNDGIGDIDIEGLLRVYQSPSFLAHASLGFEFPTGDYDATGFNLGADSETRLPYNMRRGSGSVSVVPGLTMSTQNEFPTGDYDATGFNLGADTETRLPYNMRRGSGSVSVVPGLTMSTQNEFATVGAQVKARLRVNDNSFDWRAGDEVEANLWAGYRMNDVIAVTSGLRVLRFGSIEGQDQALDPSRDPAEDVILSGGTIVSLPLGLNVMLDEGILAGNMFSFEFDWTIHEDYENVRLGLDRTFRITWSKPYAL